MKHFTAPRISPREAPVTRALHARGEEKKMKTESVKVKRLASRLTRRQFLIAAGSAMAATAAGVLVGADTAQASSPIRRKKATRKKATRKKATRKKRATRRDIRLRKKATRRSERLRVKTTRRSTRLRKKATRRSARLLRKATRRKTRRR
jgi:hypothetical protein